VKRRSSAASGLQQAEPQLRSVVLDLLLNPRRDACEHYAHVCQIFCPKDTRAADQFAGALSCCVCTSSQTEYVRTIRASIRPSRQALLRAGDGGILRSRTLNIAAAGLFAGVIRANNSAASVKVAHDWFPFANDG